MICHLVGTVIEMGRADGLVVIECQGVGYGVRATARLLNRLELGKSCSVTVHTDVREDAIRLFGFADSAERDVFALLMRVTGVGTKIARDIVSQRESTEILRALGRSDVGFFQGVKGVGKKTAERIIIELRDRVAEYATQPGFSAVGASPGAHVENGFAGDAGAVEAINVASDAEAALMALGFSREESRKGVLQALKAEGKSEDPGTLVARALAFL